MKSIMEVDAIIDIDLAHVRQSENSFVILTDLDETIPADDPPSPGVEVESELSDLSYLNIELVDDDIESVESVGLEEPAQQEVSRLFIMAVVKIMV
jgi:hypothetical protein